MSLPITFRGPFQVKLFHDSVNQQGTEAKKAKGTLGRINRNMAVVNIKLHTNLLFHYTQFSKH